MKRKVLSIFMAAVISLLPAGAFAENSKAETIETEKNESGIIYMPAALSESGDIANATPQISSGETKTAAGMEKPEIIHINEEIDIDFEIKPSDISLFGAEKDLFDCGTDYAYQDFAKRSNPEGRQAFYNKLSEINHAFASDSQDVPETTNGYIISEIDISSYNLTEDEADEVYFSFLKDHPEYYWLHVGNFPLAITDNLAQTAYISIYGDFASGNARLQLNETMRKSIEKYAQMVDGYSTSYEIALLLHNAIIDDVEYGYDENGTPLDNSYARAHNIVGVLDGDFSTDVVCEGYARTYQLLLNYFGIDNVILTGGIAANDGEHEWNLVKMDDGKYYQVDVTWDDAFFEDVSYDYFATGYENWMDRIIHNSSETGWYFLYDLPDIETDAYKPEFTVGAPLRTEFSAVAGGNTFYCTVTQNSTIRHEAVINTFPSSQSVIEIPEYVTYNDVDYHITQVGNDKWIDFILANENKNLKTREIIFPDSVSYIGHNVFMYCPNVEKINIPSALRDISFKEELKFLSDLDMSPQNSNFVLEDGALYSADKSKLYFRERGAKNKSFAMPDTVTEADDYALAANSCLTSAKISNNLLSIPENLFLNCSGLTEVSIPDSVTEIKSCFIMGTSVKELKLPAAFFDLYFNTNIGDSLTCDSLESITISENSNGYHCEDGVLYKDNMLVKYPTGKKDEAYQIPDNITGFYDQAFNDVKYLKDIYLHKDCAAPENCGYYLYGGTTNNISIENFFVDENNPNISSDDNGVLYNKNKDTILWYPPGKDEQTYVIPDYVQRIGTVAFANRQGAPEKVVLSDGVKHIDSGAFSGSAGLKEVTFNNGLETIGGAAFSGCTSLKEAILPDSLTSLEGEDFEVGNPFIVGVFQDCSSMTNIKLSENLQSVGFQCFAGCKNLSVTVPQSVRHIGQLGFSNVNEIIFEGDCPELDLAALQNTSGGIIYYYDGKNGFENNDAIDSDRTLVKLSPGKTPDDEIDPLEYLEWEEYGDGTYTAVLSPDIKVLYGTMKIPSEYNGSEVTGFSAEVQEGYLKRIDIPDSVKRISVQLVHCPILREINIGAGAEDVSIEDNGNGYLRGGLYINVDENNPYYTSEDGVLFNKDKTELVSYHKDAVNPNYEIPRGVKKIKRKAFYNCYNLKSVTVSEGVTCIDYAAFGKCSSLESISLPSSIEKIGDHAFQYCRKLGSITIPANAELPGNDIYKSTFAGCGIRLYNNMEFFIRGYAGSPAEQYALRNNIKFVALDVPPEISVSHTTYGEHAEFTLTASDESSADCLAYAALYLAEYDGEGRLIDVSKGANSIIKGKVMNITADLPKTDNYKYMLWYFNMYPFIDAITDIYN